jgi:LEA14-like dessication related protein
MRSLIVVLIIAISFVFTACTSLEEVKVGDIKEVKIENMNSQSLNIALKVTIDNPNRASITLTNADLTVNNGTTVMGKIKQIDDLKIEGKSKKEYQVKASVELTNSIATLASAFSFLTGKKPDYRIIGTMKAKSFWISKKIDINQSIPLNF